MSVCLPAIGQGKLRTTQLLTCYKTLYKHRKTDVLPTFPYYLVCRLRRGSGERGCEDTSRSGRRARRPPAPPAFPVSRENRKALLLSYFGVTTGDNHDKIVSLTKNGSYMKVLSERQDTSDGTGISCLGDCFNACDIRQPGTRIR